MKSNSTQTGFSLIELMVSLTVASLLSIAVVSAFSAQSSVYLKQAQRMQSNDDGRQSFEVLSRLVRHAESGSVAITNTDDANGKDILVKFSVPRGFPIWPNITPDVNGIFSNNFVYIKWANNDVGDNVANQIRIANSNTSTVPADSDFLVLSGANTGSVTRITGFDLVQQNDNLNYRLSIVARMGMDQNSAETYFDGFILPRN